jgi:tetratricopeptide (TPR) repeat protein
VLIRLHFIPYEQKGSYEEAIAAFQERLKLRSDYIHCLGPLGRAYAVSGRQVEARKILDQLKGLFRRRYVMPYHLATIYTALGDKDQAFAWLQKAYDERGRPDDVPQGRSIMG